MGRVLAAIQIPKHDEEKLNAYLKKIRYSYKLENENILYENFIILFITLPFCEITIFEIF